MRDVLLIGLSGLVAAGRAWIRQGSTVARHQVIMGTLCIAWALAGGAGQAAEPLRPYNADPASVSVSGISSGGYMTVQFHLAFSASIAGAGIVAGGTYYCAEGSMLKAKSSCMATLAGEPDPEQLVGVARAAAAAGTIDPLDKLARARVYIAGGSRDPVVTPPVVEALRRFYLLAGMRPENLKVETKIAAGHAFLTTDFGLACGETGSPFISDCDYDQAGAILNHIYGGLAAPVEPRSGLVEFDQGEFLPDPGEHGLDARGFLYVPSSCASGARCRLHVALHGCLQGHESEGDVFATRAGYNRWAESNGILVLYPQAVATLTNPTGCWDWYGYDDDNYHLKSGRQMAALKGMVDRLASAR